MSYSRMLNMFPAWTRRVSIAVLLAGIVASAEAADSPFLKGAYSGYVTIFQTKKPVSVYTATSIKIAGSKTAPRISIAGDNGGTPYVPQTIICKSNGEATVSAILPGQTAFSQPVKGVFKTTAGKSMIFSGSFDKLQPNGAKVPGSLEMTISKLNFNSTIQISSRVMFKDGDTIYVTVVGASTK